MPRNTGPRVILARLSQRSRARTWQVSSPRILGRVTSAPFPAWSALLRGMWMTTPSASNGRCTRSIATSSRAAQGAGEARQEQRAVAQAGQVFGTAGDQLLDLNGGQGCCRAHWPAVLARDADQGFPDRRLLR